MLYKDCFTAMPDKFQFRSLAPTSFLFPPFCHLTCGLFSFQTAGNSRICKCEAPGDSGFDFNMATDDPSVPGPQFQVEEDPG